MHRWLAPVSIAIALAGPACGPLARGLGGEPPSALAAAQPRAIVQFPSRDQLAGIAAQPVTSAPASTHSVFHEAWDLSGPFPDAAAAGPIDPASSPAAALLMRAIGEEDVRATTTMGCAARELARFHITHPESDQRIARFVLARCGSTATRSWLQTYNAEVPASATEQTVVERHGAQLEAALHEDIVAFLATGARDVGIGVATDGRGHATIAIVAVAEDLTLAERAPIVAAGVDHVILRGRLERTFQYLTATATFGPSDYADCEIASSVALPDVAIRCPVAPGDSIAWVDVLGFVEGRVLGTAVARVLVRRDEAAQLPALAIDATLDAASPGLVEAILARANAIRAEHGRAPLALELAQSASVQGITPAWFAAEAAGDTATSDLIALGLIAGWDVTAGTIRDAHLAVSMVDTTESPGEWLALVMEEPVARAVLLDPDARSAAIGARWDPERGAFTGLLVTYEVFEDAPLGEARDAVLANLVAARARVGLPAPQYVTESAPLAEAAGAVRTGRTTPGQALDRAMQQTAYASGRGVRAYLVEGIAPEAMTWPDAIVRMPHLAIASTMTWYRVPGAAWGQYALLVLIIE